MKKLLILILLLNTSLIIFSQEVYKTASSSNGLLFLGAENSEGLLKVLDGNTIKYVSKDDLEQVEQLAFDKMFERFHELNMEVTCSGYEPFWNLIMKKDSVKGLIIDKNIDTPVDYYYTQTLGWGWSLMFKSKDGNIVGLVRRPVSDCHCEFELDEDTSFYESFVCVDGIVYEGCVFINKE